MSAERIEIVRTSERLAEIGPAWMDLWRESGALVFQSHAWISAWWATAPDRRRRTLQIVLAWRGDALEAVLPVATLRRGGLRILEWAAKDHSDYCDVLVARSAAAGIVPRLWAHISAAGGFDLVYLNRMLPDSEARALVNHSASVGVRLKPNHRTEINYRLIGSWNDGTAWFDSQPKNTRHTYRRRQKFIGEKGTRRFRLWPSDEPLDPVVARLAMLKRMWLTRTGLASSLYDEGTPALPALLRVLHDLGLLRVFVLECDDVIIAVAVNFVQRDMMMAFVSAYDPEFDRASPGTCLFVDYTRWAFDRGLVGIDHLCGAEAYKSRFATSNITLTSVMGWRTLPGAAAMMLDTCNVALRDLRRRVAKPAPASTGEAKDGA